MNQPSGNSDKQQPYSDPLETHPQTDGSTKVSPELNTQAARQTKEAATDTKEPAMKDWHKPLGIPITDWVVALLTVVIAGSSIIYTVYAKRQWKVMQESNEINRESLTSVQRAFVSFQRFEYFRLQDADNPNVHNWDVLADFDNNGATNATDVIGILQIQELSAEPTDEQFRGPYTHFPAIAIPPKATRAERIPRPIPEPLIFGIDLGPVITAKSGTRTYFNRNLFVWSWVYYRDVFPKTKPHVTEFCNQLTGINFVTQNYNPLPGQSTAGNLNFSYAGCRSHNCDDEQCKDYQAIVELAERP
jgi:hypothetical protein